MKKISTKIVLSIVLCSSLILIVSGLITFNSFSKVVRSHIVDEIQLLIEKEALFFERETDRAVRTVKSINGIAQSTLDLNRLKDPGYLDIYKEEQREIYKGVAKSTNRLGCYFYMAPEIDLRGQISINDVDGDGVYSSSSEFYISEQDLSDPGMSFYTAAIRYGTNWTEPYYDKVLKKTVISYTEAVVIDNKKVGIVGSDFIIDDLVNRINQIKLLGQHSLTLFDKDLTFLADEDLQGESLKKVEPEIYRDFRKSLKKNPNSGQIDYNFEGEDKVLFYRVLNNGWIITAGISYGEILKEVNSNGFIYLIITIIGIVLAAIVALYIGKTITKPIKHVALNMKQLSSGDGDLTKSIEVETRDETAELASAFNVFINNLKGIVGSIKDSSQKSGDIGSSLNASSSTAASASVQIDRNIKSIEGQIEKLNNNIMDTTSGIEQIGANIAQFKNQIGDQVSAVEESSAAIEEMIASIENVSVVTNKKLESTKKLVETTKQGEGLLLETSTSFKEGIADKIGDIKDMIAVISNISSRTNLLAMNAAIEAAHAGEAGKGFAVVADEIRKMAEEASNSSQTISNIISVIVGAIHSTDENVDKTSDAFKEIFKEVKDLDITLNEIASSTIELSTGGQEILNAVSLLKDTSTLISGGIEEIESGSDEITSSMESVQNISSEVLSGVNEISYGVKDVATSFEEVSELAESLDNETDVLSREVGRFII